MIQAPVLSEIENARSVFERMRNYENPVLLNKMQAELALAPAEAQILFEDVKKFLALSAGGKRPFAPPHLVDEGWHLFILFTRDYELFCKEYFGHFVHHVPEDPFSATKDYESIPRTFRIAAAVFGDLSRNWGLSGEAAKCAKPLPPCTHCLNKCSPAPPTGSCTPGIFSGVDSDNLAHLQ